MGLLYHSGRSDYLRDLPASPTQNSRFDAGTFAVTPEPSSLLLLLAPGCSVWRLSCLKRQGVRPGLAVVVIFSLHPEGRVPCSPEGAPRPLRPLPLIHQPETISQSTFDPAKVGHFNAPVQHRRPSAYQDLVPFSGPSVAQKGNFLRNNSANYCAFSTTRHRKSLNLRTPNLALKAQLLGDCYLGGQDRRSRLPNPRKDEEISVRETLIKFSAFHSVIV